jgi:hypothetical protein
MIKLTVTEIGRITGMGHENTDSIQTFTRAKVLNILIHTYDSFSRVALPCSFVVNYCSTSILVISIYIDFEVCTAVVMKSYIF